jgi:hypothetical protein
MEKKGSTKRISVYLAIILGLFLCSLAIFFYIQDNKIFSSYIKTKGTFVSQNYTFFIGKGAYCPVIKFQTNDDKEIIFQSKVCYKDTINIHYEGQPINVKYDPENPLNAEIDNPLNLNPKAILLFIFGIIFLLGGLLSLKERK